MTNVNFPYRVTIVVPEAMIPDANELALVLGEAPGDVNTFGGVWARDAGGARYAIACTHGGPGFPTDARSELTAPDHAPDADLEAATRAQTALVIGTPDNPEMPAPDRITALLGPNDRPDPLPDHMALMGLVFDV
jgi:hypothetical protein